MGNKFEEALVREQRERAVYGEGKVAGERFRRAMENFPEETQAIIGTVLAQNLSESSAGEATAYSQGIWHGLEDPRVLSVAKQPIKTDEE